MRWKTASLTVAVFVLFLGTAASGNDLWVAPTHQQDVGGLGVAAGGVWPVTPEGAVRLAWAIPDDLKTFESAKLVLIPQTSAAAATLTLFVCPAQSSQVATAACVGPITQTFASTASQLLDIDVS